MTVSVKEVRGKCPLYQVGDKMVVDNFYINTQESNDVCVHAFSAMLSLLSAFAHGSSAVLLGIGRTDDIGYLQCPDPGAPYTDGGTVLFELRRKILVEKQRRP